MLRHQRDAPKRNVNICLPEPGRLTHALHESFARAEQASMASCRSRSRGCDAAFICERDISSMSLSFFGAVLTHLPYSEPRREGGSIKPDRAERGGMAHAPQLSLSNSFGEMFCRIARFFERAEQRGVASRRARGQLCKASRFWERLWSPVASARERAHEGRSAPKDFHASRVLVSDFVEQFDEQGAIN